MPKMDHRRNENFKIRDSKPTQFDTKLFVCVCVCMCGTELIIEKIKSSKKKKPVFAMHQHET